MRVVCSADHFARRAFALAFVLSASFIGVSPLLAQNNNGGDAAGIIIDPEGVVHPVIERGRSEKLDKRRMSEAAENSLPSELNTSSDLRKVSLVKLEAACAPFADESETIPKEMFYLAGLQRIDYVFVYPESNDIVIAGPAEGFARNSIGRTVGVSTGRPPLRLDDVAIAFRAASHGKRVRCSIDPVPERLADLKQYIAANSDAGSAARAKSRYHEMAAVLGLAKVSLDGVADDSHFAQTLVEADYRMKRIGMALEPSGVKGIRSHLSMLQPEGNTMQRWWLAPLYDAIVTSEDRLAFELLGQRVQLLAQEEVSDGAGNRRSAGGTRLSTEKYAQQFTENYSELADKNPVFAELQNLFDLLVVATMLRKEGISDRVGWKAETFLDDSRFSYPRHAVPRQVPSVANSKRANRSMIVGLVGGGVMMTPSKLVESLEFRVETERQLDEKRGAAAGDKTAAADKWWWD